MGNGGPSAAQDVVGGRYRLLEAIGAGGMGTVWKAEDQLLHRVVAVKEITTPAGLSTSELLDRQLATMREARAAARLDHPGVVQVFDVVWRPGRSWIVLEYIPSRSLHQVILTDGPLSHREAARIGLGVLSALRAAHQAGVLHRDVKPHNVLLTDDGRVVLTDFGLATLESELQLSDKPEPLFGSPFYVAPERLRGERSSERSDLWSLGATLYSAVEGRPPFRRDSTTRSLTALLTEPPDPPAHPGPLGPVLAGLLVKDPARRLTADQAEPLMRRVADRAIGIFPIPRAAAAAATGTPRRVRLAAVAAAVVLLGAAGAAAVLGRDSGGSLPVAIAPASSGAVPSCANAGSPVTGTPEQTDYLLPDGWLWHLDQAGQRMAVPFDWTQVAAGHESCFRDPASGRSLTVDTGVRPSGPPVAHWEQTERAALAAGSLPGYRRIAVTGRPDGAEWEYTWQPPTGPRRHEQRTLVAHSTGRGYVVDWSTPDRDWSVNLPYLHLVLASLN